MDVQPDSSPGQGGLVGGDREDSIAEPLGIVDREDLFARALLEKPSSREQLRVAHGPADSITSRTVPNRHIPGAIDSLVALHYPGLIVRFHVPGPGGEIVSQVETRDNRYLAYPLVGAPFDRVEEAIGPPDRRGDSIATYLCRMCVAGDDPVEMVVRDGRISRLRFNYYVD